MCAITLMDKSHVHTHISLLHTCVRYHLSLGGHCKGLTPRGISAKRRVQIKNRWQMAVVVRRLYWILEIV